jgi:hypothetical protein
MLDVGALVLGAGDGVWVGAEVGDAVGAGVGVRVVGAGVDDGVCE